MIINLNYAGSFSNLDFYTWAEISEISRLGLAPNYFQVGETKGPATLIDVSTSTMLFSLGYVGEACIARASTTPGVPGSPATFTYQIPYVYTVRYMNFQTTGWYTNNPFQSGGVTLGSVWYSLPSALKAVIKDKTDNVPTLINESGIQPDPSMWSSYKLFPPNEMHFIEGFSYGEENGRIVNYQIPENLKCWTRKPHAIYWDDSPHFEESYKIQSNDSTSYYYDGYSYTRNGGVTGNTMRSLVLLFEV